MSFPKLPTSSPPPLAGDDLAGIVRRRLERPLPNSSAWGLFTTIILGTASFGLLPLIVWPTRFRQYVEEESRGFQEFAEWVRARGRRPAAAAPVLAAAEDLCFRPIPWLACVLLAIFVVASFAIQVANATLSWSELLSCTYYFHLGHHTPFWTLYLHRVWVGSLAFGYFLHWLQVRTHVSDVRRFVDRINPVITAELLPPLSKPSRSLSFFCPMWIVAAVMMISYGAWWSIPMLMAAAAQRRYVRAIGPTVRRDLITRLRDIEENRRMPAAQIQHCSNSRCLAPLPPLARYCKRCGSAVG